MSQFLYDMNHNNFQNYYLQNKDKKWNEWLVILPDQNQKKMDGKQGYVGILHHPQNKKLCCLYKISKVDDNLVEHEWKMLKGLETISTYCPHFHKVYGIIPFDSNLHYNNEPLYYNTKSKIVTRPMLLTQFIHHKYNFREMIEDPMVKDEYVINIIKQIILCIYMSHKYKFTHYDLHTENILIRNCNPNMHILYILDNATEILMPTFGYIPNIIDYGFSYCDVPNNNLTCTLVHTQYGFTSARFDPFADIKLFLISTCDDMSRSDERTHIAKRFKNINRNIFSGMNVQWSSGWDNSKQISPVDIIRELVKDYVSKSNLFSKSDLWFDSIQQLIDLPLKPMPYHELEKSFICFIDEFVKFEERIISKTLLNYVLRILVKYVREYRESYLKQGDEGSWAILEIKKHFLDEYTQIVNFHIPSIDWERLICSLLIVCQCLEGLFYDYLEKRYQEKDKQYEIMRCKDMLDFYRVFDYNFSYNEKSLSLKSTVLVVDHLNKKSRMLSIRPENLKIIEKLKTKNNIQKYLRNLYTSIST